MITKIPKPARLAARSALTFFMLLTQPLLQRFPWKVTWVVNAGTESDVKAFGPAPKILRAVGVHVFPLGFFWAKGAGLSVYLGSPYTNDRFRDDPELCKTVLEQAQKWNSKRIALNGVLPSVMHMHNLWPENDDRFVKQQHATVFMICQNVEQIHELHPDLRDCKVAVLGAGHTGRAVANRLHDMGHEVFCIDPRVPELGLLHDDIKFVGDDFSTLSDAGIVVVLSANGDDAVQHMYDHMKPNTAIISDTHPKISGRWVEKLLTRNIHVYESALTRDGYTIFPKLPRWDKTTVAGCVGQAFVECIVDKQAITQEEFDTMAEQTVTARLDIPNVRRKAIAWAEAEAALA